MAALREFRRYFDPKKLQFLVTVRSCSQQQVTTESLNNPHSRDLIVEDDDSHYPPVIPKLPPGNWGDLDRKIAWHWYNRKEEISELKTVQQKLHYLSQHKLSTWIFHPVARVPRLFNYQCDKTKTYSVLESPNAIDKLAILPELYKDVKLNKTAVEECKQLLQNYIESTDFVSRSKFTKRIASLKTRLTNKFTPEVDNELSHVKTKELLMMLISCLGGHYKHVQECTMEENVRVAATWYRHGVERVLNTDPFTSKINKLPPNFIKQNNAGFFGEHVVNFQIRKKDPLPQFVSLTDNLLDSVSYPSVPYKPVYLGQFRNSIRLGFDPGFNIGDPNEFIHVNVVLLNERHLSHMLKMYGEDSYIDALFGYAMSTGFLSAVAQAHFQGFNMYEDITYPVTTQTILTDGHKFIFSAYQLNTLELWKDDLAQRLHNVCWVSQPQSLWNERDVAEEGTSSSATKAVIDDKIFETLLKFLTLTPTKVKNGRPNLHKESKPKVDDIIIPRGNEHKALTKHFQSIKYVENGFKILNDYTKLKKE